MINYNSDFEKAIKIQRNIKTIDYCLREMLRITNDEEFKKAIKEAIKYNNKEITMTNYVTR